MLQLSRIEITFEKAVIQDGNLTIPSGKLTALTGPSGSGKTTLLYCVGLISSNKKYEFVFDGKQIDLSSEQEKGALRKAKIGYVFQENNLNPNLTVGENVRMSASLAGADTSFTEVTTLLARVGMKGRENDDPKSLSGGEQQRVAIACVLAKNPELIIADEPTSSLDTANTEQVLKLFGEIAAQGKMVVIATHSPAVVERCDLVYEIQDKKLVLVKGQKYIESEPDKPKEWEKQEKVKMPFFLRYQFKTGKKGQFLKNLTVAVCALSIAFTALSTGYIKDFAEHQQKTFKAISQRELVVSKRWDPHYPMVSAFQEETLSLTEEQIEQLQQIDGVEKSGPVSMFKHRTELWEEELNIDYSEPLQEGAFNTYISYRNQFGKTGTVGFCSTDYYNTETGESLYEPSQDIVPMGYTVASYFSYESMDLKSVWIDQSVPPDQGIYVSSELFENMGLDKTDLGNLQFTIDVAIPVKRMISTSMMTNDDGTSYQFDSAWNWCVKRQITLPVRGVIDPFVISAPIYAPSAIMVQYIEENRIDKIPDEYYEKNPEAKGWIKETYDWRPWAYYLMVDDVENIDAVKKAVAEIAPDLDVIHEYQDYEAIMESVDNSQKVVLYISLAILAVILCLSAIVYVNIIDKRKYEFAMLRANGLTKGEIRKLVMTEMGVQAVWTFAVSLLLAWVVFLILSNTIGGFQFDWMTVMWLAVISVVSVILPSVVALVLTNKYEPDAIMRN